MDCYCVGIRRPFFGFVVAGAFLILGILVGHAQAAEGNLLEDPDFDSEAEVWEGCGRWVYCEPEDPLIRARTVRSGIRSVRLASDDGPGCGDVLFDPAFSLNQKIRIPGDATRITISFWYSRVGDPRASVLVSLGSIELPRLRRAAPLGWSLYWIQLTPAQVEQIRDSEVELKFSAPGIFGGDDEFPGKALNDPADGEPGFYVDDVRVTKLPEAKPVNPEDPLSTSDNLLPQGDFETRTDFWEFCGGRCEIVNAARLQSPDRFVRFGQNSLRIAYDPTQQCRNEVLGDNFKVGHRLVIPPDTDALTVSFWYSRVGDPGANVVVSLLSFDPSIQSIVLPNIPASQPTGWAVYHHVLRAEQVRQIRGQTLLLRFSANGLVNRSPGVGIMPADPSPVPNGLFLDNIRVIPRNAPKPGVPEDPTILADDLLKNGGFETGFSGWEFCGEVVELADVASPNSSPLMVHRGQKAMRLNYDLERRCRLDSIGSSLIAAKGVVIPDDTRELTLSFWYSRIGNPRANLAVTFSSAFEDGLGRIWLENVPADSLAGWTMFRYSLNTNQVQALRGRRVYLELSFQPFSFGPEVSDAFVKHGSGLPGFYIDDVRLAPRIERTRSSTMPEILKQDRSQPIAFLSGKAGGIARMNPDGSGVRLVTRGMLNQGGLSPAWNGRNDGLLFLESWLAPDQLADPEKEFRAKITVIEAVPADGGAPRELNRSSGVVGKRALPLGCEVLGNPMTFCTDQESKALDVEIPFVESEPWGDRVAYSICARSRGFNGHTEDPSCWIQIQRPSQNLLSDPTVLKIPGGFRASWHGSGKLLYAYSDVLSDDVQGVQMLDLNSVPLQPRPMIPNGGKRIRIALFPDRNPVWSPDGRHFATVRKVAGGYWLGGGGDLLVHRRFVDGVFFHDSENADIPQNVLLSDHGDGIEDLVFSPDGRFIYYTLRTGRSSDIWWLEIASRQSGPVTADGLSAVPAWKHVPIAGPDDRPNLSMTRSNGKDLRLKIAGKPGNYSLRATEDLVNWREVRSISIGPGGEANIDSLETVLPGSRRFFSVWKN